MHYCAECGCERPDGTDCEPGCSIPEVPGFEGYASMVDRLMASGYDREEAELLANAGMSEEDAA